MDLCCGVRGSRPGGTPSPSPWPPRPACVCAGGGGGLRETVVSVAVAKTILKTSCLGSQIMTERAVERCTHRLHTSSSRTSAPRWWPGWPTFIPSIYCVSCTLSTHTHNHSCSGAQGASHGGSLALPENSPKQRPIHGDTHKSSCGTPQSKHLDGKSPPPPFEQGKACTDRSLLSNLPSAATQHVCLCGSF